jgi:hypothetical protein
MIAFELAKKATDGTVGKRAALLGIGAASIVGLLTGTRLHGHTAPAPLVVPVKAEASAAAKADAVATSAASSNMQQQVEVDIPVTDDGKVEYPGAPGYVPGAKPTPGTRFIKILVNQQGSSKADSGSKSDAVASSAAKAEVSPPPVLANGAAAAAGNHWWGSQGGPKSDLTDVSRWGLMTGTMNGYVAVDYQAVRQSVLGTEFSVDAEANHAQAGVGVSMGSQIFLQVGVSRDHLAAPTDKLHPYVGVGLRARF